MKYFAFLILLIASSCSSKPNWQKERERTIELSRGVQSGSKQVALSLTDYSRGTDEAASLDHFIRSTTDLTKFTIQPVTHEIGWSGNNAYTVFDTKSGEIKFYLKQFKKKPDQLFAEIYGMDYLQKVNGISSPRFHAIGKILDKTMILETPALGRSFQFYYNQVGSFPLDSAERREALELLLEGCQRAGSALAKLHSHEEKKSIPFPERMGEALKKISPANYQECIDRAIQRMRSEPHLTGVVHDDVKLVHLFYDPNSKTISIIDPGSLANNLKSNPGILSSDFYQFSRSLLLNRFGYTLDETQNGQKTELLTLDEATQAMAAFREGYIAEGGIPPTAIEEDFFLLRHNLLFVSHADQKLPEPYATRLRDLVALSLSELQARLEP